MVKAKQMSDKEFESINKEIEEWNKLKKDIKDKADLVSIDNYDEDSIIFTILGLKNKKEKKKFMKVLIKFQENTFISTFNAMSDYFENTLRKNYVFIDDISVFKNIFGIIQDRIKSNKNSIKDYKKQIKETKDKIVKSKNYDEIQSMKYDLWRYENDIKDNESTISLMNSLHTQLKYDIKNLETSSSINKANRSKDEN